MLAFCGHGKYARLPGGDLGRGQGGPKASRQQGRCTCSGGPEREVPCWILYAIFLSVKRSARFLSSLVPGWGPRCCCCVGTGQEKAQPESYSQSPTPADHTVSASTSSSFSEPGAVREKGWPLG